MSRHRGISPLAGAALARMDERLAFPPPPSRKLSFEFVLRRAEHDAYEEEAHRNHPHAQALADAIAGLQPTWAESEECNVVVLEVADALDSLGLKLVRA